MTRPTVFVVVHERRDGAHLSAWKTRDDAEREAARSAVECAAEALRAYPTAVREIHELYEQGRYYDAWELFTDVRGAEIEIHQLEVKEHANS